MVTLSVHLITFNNEEHIEQTILSILKQDLNFSYEIVVGDDCSTDNTFDIISTYAKLHPGIFKIKKNNKQLGILKNFKATLDRCKGKYVYDIAGDDFLNSSDALQKMIDTFNSNPKLGFIDSGYDRLEEKTNKKKPFKNHNFINSEKQNYKKYVLLGKIANIGHCYSRDALYKYVDFDRYLSENFMIDDYPILVDLIMNTDFELINCSLQTYRVHNSSYSHTKNLQEMISQKSHMKELFNFFNSKYYFPQELISTFNETYNKEILFLSGFYTNKNLGKQYYKKIKNKDFRDYIHFFASQSKRFRKIIALRKKLFLRFTHKNI